MIDYSALGERALYDLMITGDKEARKQMIERYIPLTYDRVRKHIEAKPQFGYLRDDLLGEAQLAVVKAVDTMIREPDKDPKPGGYIALAIYNKLQKFGNEFDSLGASDSTQKRQKDKGRTPPREIATDPEDFPDVVDESGDASEELEFILSCCKNETERDIIELRRQGYKDTEIGKRLDMKWKAVYDSRKKIEKRYLKKLKEIE